MPIKPNPTTTTISTISTKPTLNDLYLEEIEAATKELAHLETLGINDQYTAELTNNIAALQLRTRQYETAERIKTDKLRKAAQKISDVINPTVGLAWNLLLGVGIILQETVAVTAPILGAFLFPLNYALDGLRSIVNLYQTARDSAAAHRKTVLGTNVVHILALVAASAVIGLAITNPFALPVIFLGITGAGMYKSSYALLQTRKSIEASEKELHDTQIAIGTLKGVKNLEEKDKLHLANLQAKENRLTKQLTHLKAERSELRRQSEFNSLGMVAVGLLLASAVITLIFPPAAAALAGVGMLLFASTVIASVLSSPPVIAKIKQAGRWIAGLFGAKENNVDLAQGLENDVSQTHGNELVANEDENATANAPLLVAAPSGANDERVNDRASPGAEVTISTAAASSNAAEFDIKFPSRNLLRAASASGLLFHKPAGLATTESGVKLTTQAKPL